MQNAMPQDRDELLERLLGERQFVFDVHRRRVPTQGRSVEGNRRQGWPNFGPR